MKIGILLAQTDRSEFAAGWPDDGRKFTRLLAQHRPDWRFEVVEVRDGELPAAPDEFDGYVITGSIASVHDPDPWIAALLEFLRAAHAEKIPMFGACFGHQALALALGGAVGPNPDGWSMGVTAMEVVAPEVWMQPLPGPLTLHTAHLEQVTKLPEAARVLAASPHCPVAMFAVGNHIATVQYHPEMPIAFMSALLAELRGDLPDEVIDEAVTRVGTHVDGVTVGAWITEFLEHGR